MAAAARAAPSVKVAWQQRQHTAWDTGRSCRQFVRRQPDGAEVLIPGHLREAVVVVAPARGPARPGEAHAALGRDANAELWASSSGRHFATREMP